MAYTTILVVLASVTASKKCSIDQVVVQLRGMRLMIGATLKSDSGQVVVKTQTKTYNFFYFIVSLVLMAIPFR